MMFLEFLPDNTGNLNFFLHQPTFDENTLSSYNLKSVTINNIFMDYDLVVRGQSSF